MKNPFKKKILHTITDDWSKMQTTHTVTFLGIIIFKRVKFKKISVNMF